MTPLTGSVPVDQRHALERAIAENRTIWRNRLRLVADTTTNPPRK